jgi:hypothetical protein
LGVVVLENRKKNHSQYHSYDPFEPHESLSGLNTLVVTILPRTRTTGQAEDNKRAIGERNEAGGYPLSPKEFTGLITSQNLMIP